MARKIYIFDANLSKRFKPHVNPTCAGKVHIRKAKENMDNVEFVIKNSGNNNIIINQNKIPSLSDYESKIESINSSIRVVNTTINNVNSTLQEDINDKYNEITKKIDTITTDNTENITNLDNRVLAIEGELFIPGSSDSRIDEIEKKVDEIYTKLKDMGTIS